MSVSRTRRSTRTVAPRAPSSPAQAPVRGSASRPARTTDAFHAASTATASHAAFTSGIAPAVVPASAHALVLSGAWAWHEVEIDPLTRRGGPTEPALVEAGKPFVVRYTRGPSDLGDGGALARATMHFRIGDGPVQSRVLVDGTRDRLTGELVRLPARIDVPADARGTLEVWFEQQTTDGRTLWDSAYGANYRSRIVPAGGTVLRFDEAWGEAQSQSVRAGEAVRFAYDVDRMLGLLAGTQHHGVPTWGVSALVSFDGAPPEELPLVIPRSGPQGGTREIVPLEACTVVPEGARTMTVWFKGTSYAGARDAIGQPAWDSDFGRNYTFDVTP